MTDITVKELDELHRKLFDTKLEYEASKAATSTIYDDYKKLQEELAAKLEELGKSEYRTEDGMFKVRYTETFLTPKTPEDKESFYNYLRDKGVYEDMISVNSQKLNSFCKAEAEIAEQKGELDFQIPGIKKSAPVLYPYVRKK